MLEYKIVNNTLFDWGVALAIFCVVWLVLKLVQRGGISRIKALTERAHIERVRPVLEALEKTRAFVLIVFSAGVASQWLFLPPSTQKILQGLVIVSLAVQAALWLMTAIDGWVKIYRERKLASNPGAISSINALAFLVKGAIWACAFLLVLDNFGVDVTALVAGLGIGGIAVALAVQNILGDLFASLTIVLDKPFVVGDFLILGEHMGAVEHIGLKNTRLRSLSGEQIVLSNSDLLNSRIRNYGRMFERRVLTVVGVTYQTPREKLKMIPDIIKAAIESQSPVRFDRAHFKAFGAFSIDFEYVYYVLKSEFNLYMDINQAINLTIHERFEQEGIEFAYPTQTIFVEKTGEAA